MKKKRIWKAYDVVTDEQKLTPEKTVVGGYSV